MGLWEQLPGRVGLESAQQFYDHVSQTPGQFPQVNTSVMLRGKSAAPKEPGFSKTIHYEISSMARIDYQFNPAYSGGAHGDEHGVVWVMTIDLGSH